MDAAALAIYIASPAYASDRGAVLDAVARAPNREPVKQIPVPAGAASLAPVELTAALWCLAVDVSAEVAQRGIKLYVGAVDGASLLFARWVGR